MDSYRLIILLLHLCLSIGFTQQLPIVVNYDMSHAYERSASYSLHVNGQEVYVTSYHGYDYAHFSLGNGLSGFMVKKLSES